MVCIDLEVNIEPRAWRRMAGFGIFDTNNRSMVLGNFDNNGQAQPRAVYLVAQSAVERLKNQLAFGLRNAWPGVFDLQHECAAERIGEYTRGDDTGA